jgi:hypothetical protein
MISCYFLNIKYECVGNKYWSAIEGVRKGYRVQAGVSKRQVKSKTDSERFHFV